MNSSTIINKPILIIALFFGLLICSGFWLIGANFNVYTYAATGAIFEILWFPAVFLTFSIPIVSFYFWYKDKWSLKSVFPYLMTASALLVCLLII